MPWMDLTPPDNTIFSASAPIISTYSGQSGFIPTTAGKVTLNGQTLFLFSARNIDADYTGGRYTFVIDPATYVDTRSGIAEANDYTVIPNEGWPVGDNVFTIEGELLSTLYTQTRNFTVPASDYEPDMEQVAKDRFIHQFKEKVLLEAWSDAYVNQLQDLIARLQGQCVLSCSPAYALHIISCLVNRDSRCGVVNVFVFLLPSLSAAGIDIISLDVYAHYLCDRLPKRQVLRPFGF